MPSCRKLALNYNSDGDIRDQRLIASHTNLSKFVFGTDSKLETFILGSIKLPSFIFWLGITITIKR